MKLIESTWVGKKKTYIMIAIFIVHVIPWILKAVLITWLLSTRQFWSHEYSQPDSSDHMTTVSQAFLITWLLSASFDHTNTVSQAVLITWPLSTCSFDHMTTVSQAVLITWLLSARQFLSHGYCQAVLITWILYMLVRESCT
jgi:hypothetical protein